MKRSYEKPAAQRLSFDAEDIITVSGAQSIEILPTGTAASAEGTANMQSVSYDIFEW